MELIGQNHIGKYLHIKSGHNRSGSIKQGLFGGYAMKKLTLFLMLFVMCVTPLMASEHLDELNSKFTYKGKPIHPFLVREFSNWLSDNRPPMITAVDVAAASDTNKYQHGTVKKREDWWFAEEQEKDGDVTLYESFGYHWLGRLANGCHVLEIGSSGGGSGFFMDLMIVKFSEGEILWEGKKERQLLMSVKGIYSLGDRYEGKIKVYPDKIVIPASEDQRGGGSLEKGVELKFPAR